jgi:hypothetical protein
VPGSFGDGLDCVSGGKIAGDACLGRSQIEPYLANGGALKHAQEMAAHESPRTTKLYDRTKERLPQDEVERIRL